MTFFLILTILKSNILLYEVKELVKMNKKILLKITNIFLALTFFMTASGGVITAIFPNAIPADKFVLLHPKFGIAFVIFAIIHVVLNWSWIKTSFFAKK